MMRYVATISDRNGKTLYVSGAHCSRDAAAAEVFAARPRTKACTTCRANERGERTHMDIQAHRKTA